MFPSLNNFPSATKSHNKFNQTEMQTFSIICQRICIHYYNTFFCHFTTKTTRTIIVLPVVANQNFFLHSDKIILVSAKS